LCADDYVFHQTRNSIATPYPGYRRYPWYCERHNHAQYHVNNIPMSNSKLRLRVELDRTTAQYIGLSYLDINI